jgi:dimethylamine/trimethylamine dehydrogenase
MHFLARRHNHRIDEYGGSLENRARLLRELIEDTHEAVGDTCAVALRIAVDELLGKDGITSDGEGREVVEMLAELPDLWDVNISAWENDSMTARFGAEGFQERYTGFVKSLTTKPVVGVGRYTSPDRMADLVRKGVLDFIGAARPSIADPFLPKKIEEGRPEDIRECIGCNICVSGNNLAHPMRCTQNPTMSEEWRRGWHPERLPARTRDEKILVVGAGPAGLEAARALGQRGYRVSLAEARRDLGGRVARECRLPGLASWARVHDWRIGQLGKLPNVEIYRESRLSADDVCAAECSVIALATGAAWRADGVGRHHSFPLDGLGRLPVLTPDGIMDGGLPPAPVIVYDDDHYYMGGVIAEKLRRAGLPVTLVTPESMVSAFTQYTLEQARIQSRLIELGVTVLTATDLVALHAGEAEIACAYTGRTRRIAAGSVVLVTMQAPEEALYRELAARPEALAAAGIRKIVRIGDALAPGIIAAAVWSGHRFARELDLPEADDVGFRRENVALAEL